MEGFYSDPRVQKLKGVKSNTSFFDPHHFGSTSPGFDPYASDVDSTLRRYLCSQPQRARGFPGADPFATPPTTAKHLPLIPRGNSGSGVSSGSGFSSASPSPLSAVENMLSPMCCRSPAAFRTPLQMKPGEDVLVMDGVPTQGRGRASDSGGSSKASSGSSSHKREVCRAWEDTGSCRFASKCQFAHGKEELRPAHVPSKNKNELKSQSGNKTHSRMGSCLSDSKRRNFRHQHVPLAAADPVVNVSPTPKTDVRQYQAINTVKACFSSCWLPEDDGIQTDLPISWAQERPQTREQTEDFINAVLYNNPSMGRRRRLPVFEEIRLDD